MPRRLRTVLRDSAPYRGLPGRLTSLDLREADRAPRLGDAPVPTALLAAGFNMFTEDPDGEAIGTDSVYLLTPGGEWRRVDLADYGRFHREPSFTLSPDGRRLALAEGDNRAVIVVELADNSSRRYPIPVDQAVALHWSPDQRTLMFFPRDMENRGMELELRTGRVATTRYDAFVSNYLPGRGQVVELRGNSDQAGGALALYRDGKRSEVRPLQYADLTGRDPVAQEYVAFYHSSNRRAMAQGAFRGFVAVDPETGSLRAALDDRRTGQSPASVEDWIDDRRLAFDSWRPATVKVWDVDTGQVRLLADFVNRGVNISLAREPAGRLIDRTAG